MQNNVVKIHTNTLNDIASGIISTLLYFDIFRYPLTAAEIVSYCHYTRADGDVILKELDNLREKNMVSTADGYFFIGEDHSVIQRRKEGNQLAAKYLSYAKKISVFMSLFPFVRGVMISGSLSKNYMDTFSDIDYFVVTAKSRLWLCRSSMAIFRKILPARLKRYFCINYFVAEDTLLIPDQNLFTATELIFIYPAYNAGIYADLLRLNPWVSDYYPNVTLKQEKVHKAGFPALIRKCAEFPLSGSIGEKLDTWLFQLMLKRWKKRYADFDEGSFDLNIRTRKNVSKQHEKGHQVIILRRHEEKILSFEMKHELRLNNG